MMSKHARNKGLVSSCCFSEIQALRESLMSESHATLIYEIQSWLPTGWRRARGTNKQRCTAASVSVFGCWETLNICKPWFQADREIEERCGMWICLFAVLDEKYIITFDSKHFLQLNEFWMQLEFHWIHDGLDTICSDGAMLSRNPICPLFQHALDLYRLRLVNI